MLEIKIPYLDINKYYGILNSLGNKGFVVREDFNRGFFTIMCPDSMTNGNCYSNGYTSLNNLAIEVISIGHKIYQFDTYKELFEWLVKKEE